MPEDVCLLALDRHCFKSLIKGRTRISPTLLNKKFNDVGSTYTHQSRMLKTRGVRE